MVERKEEEKKKESKKIFFLPATTVRHPYTTWRRASRLRLQRAKAWRYSSAIEVALLEEPPTVHAKRSQDWFLNGAESSLRPRSRPEKESSHNLSRKPSNKKFFLLFGA